MVFHFDWSITSTQSENTFVRLEFFCHMTPLGPAFVVKDFIHTGFNFYHKTLPYMGFLSSHSTYILCFIPSAAGEKLLLLHQNSFGTQCCIVTVYIDLVVGLINMTEILLSNTPSIGYFIILYSTYTVSQKTV